MEFFQKYRLEDVGPTRARIAELIAIFETERQHMTIREFDELREEINLLADRLSGERDG